MSFDGSRPDPIGEEESPGSLWILALICLASALVMAGILFAVGFAIYWIAT